MTDDMNRTLLEAINYGFSQSHTQIDKLSNELAKISAAVAELNTEIQVLKGTVEQVEKSTIVAQDDLKELERRMRELEIKAHDLTIAVEIAKSATPMHLPERVAVIESSISRMNKLAMGMLTAFLALAVKAVWDLLRAGS